MSNKEMKEAEKLVEKLEQPPEIDWKNKYELLEIEHRETLLELAETTEKLNAYRVVLEDKHDFN